MLWSRWYAGGWFTIAGGIITFCAVGWAGGDRVMFSQGSNLSWSGWDEGASEKRIHVSKKILGGQFCSIDWHLPTVGVLASGLFMIVTALAEVAPVVMVVGGSLSPAAAPASPSPPSCRSFSPSLSLEGELSTVSPGSSSLDGWVGS